MGKKKKISATELSSTLFLSSEDQQTVAGKVREMISKEKKKKHKRSAKPWVTKHLTDNLNKSASAIAMEILNAFYVRHFILNPKRIKTYEVIEQINARYDNDRLRGFVENLSKRVMLSYSAHLLISAAYLYKKNLGAFNTFEAFIRSFFNEGHIVPAKIEDLQTIFRFEGFPQKKRDY